MTDTQAPERIWMKWREGQAVTSGPLTDHPDYTCFVRADLAQPRVKPISWEAEIHDHKGEIVSLVGQAETYNDYTVRLNADGGWVWYARYGPGIGRCDSLEDAKSAAQANYESQILSALITS